MMRQYSISCSTYGDTYTLVDLEYNPTGSKLGNKITYPPDTLFSCVIETKDKVDAFRIGVKLLDKKMDEHYAIINRGGCDG